MSAEACRHWIGSDTAGHRCTAPTVGAHLCEKHYAVELRRVEKDLAKQRERRDRENAAWLSRNASKLPSWRVQLERAEAQYARRTDAPVADRAAVGGSMHTSIVRAQRSHLSDTNITRVIELERIISRLRADIARAEKAAA